MIAAASLVVALAACVATPERVGLREREWQDTLQTRIPAGTPRADAEQFLASRGVRAVWLRKVSGLKDDCPGSLLSGRDAGIARSVYIVWDLEIHVCLDESDRVTGHRVYVFNQGL
jgi:hypothetical protein